MKAARALKIGALDRGDEPVAAAVQRLDKSRIVRVVAERGPQPLHRGVEAVLEINEGPLGPQPIAQLLPRDDVAGPLEHDRQNLERLILQPYPNTALAQLARAQIDFEDSEFPERRGPAFQRQH